MKIAFILFTNGLEYDDRIRKEMMSMREVLGDVEFKVFSFHADNHKETGFLSYGVPYELVSLKNRGGGKGFFSMLNKEYDFYSQINAKIKSYDLLWLCDEHPFFFTLLSRKPIIWDLHEIPAKLTGSYLKNMLFHQMERRCRCLIHANYERLDFLVDRGIIKSPAKNYVLRNYPDQEWIGGVEKTNSSFEEFKKWLGNNEYIYLQGLSGKGRCSYETLASILETKSIKAVVIGKVPENIKREIISKYKHADDYVYYTGQLVQSETAPFISHCKFSMVFYSQSTPNNQLCEPNRLFQCLALGKPVIVGNNKPLKNVIGHYQNGVVLDSDGSNIADIVNAMNIMLSKYSYFSERADAYKVQFSWESQNVIFETIFGHKG